MTFRNLLDRIESHLVADWKQLWTFTSVHYVLILGAITTYFSEPANWSSLASTFYSIPAEYRSFVPPALGFIVGIVPVVLRVWNQGKRNG